MPAKLDSTWVEVVIVLIAISSILLHRSSSESSVRFYFHVLAYMTLELFLGYETVFNDHTAVQGS